MFIYFTLLLFISLSYAKVLTKTQLKYITNILNNPNSPAEIREKTKAILVHYHDKWLHKQVHEFAKKNKLSFLVK